MHKSGDIGYTSLCMKDFPKSRDYRVKPHAYSILFMFGMRHYVEPGFVRVTALTGR